MPTTRRIWIDVLLALGGAGLIVKGVALMGVPLVLLALVAPALRLRQRERGHSLYALVPSDLADAHGAVSSAASLPGVLDGPDVLEAADEALLEAAVLLVGRPPRGAAQRRFVAARVTAMRETASLLRERHDAVVAAMEELGALVPPVEARSAAVAESRGGFVVRLLAVLFMPAFIAWDLAAVIVRLLGSLVEGVALRLRAALRVAVVAFRAVGAVLGQARDSWRVVRASLVHAARDARRSATGLRLRSELELRHMRRRFRVG